MGLTPVQKKFEKYTTDLWDYDFVFNRLSSTDSVSSVNAAIAGDDEELSVDHIEISGVIAKVWLAGGTGGNTYVVKVRIGSAEGRSRTLKMKLAVLEPDG